MSNQRAGFAPAYADDPPTVETVLGAAAEAAARAPSIMNSQPWHWRIHGATLELSADTTRQVRSIDPDGRLLTLSCGASLHHARAALFASGHDATVVRFPDPASPSLLAQIRLSGTHPVRRRDVQMLQAIRDRRTDRRPFAAIRPVPATILLALASTAHGEHAMLHHVGQDQRVFLSIAARVAQSAESMDEQYLAELQEWTSRARGSGEGVPRETIMAAIDRPVPLRNFAVEGEALLHPGIGDDRFAEYLILATADDAPRDWLAVGEATSAVWLAATKQGLAASPMSDVVEIAAARAILATLLPQAGHPQLVLRVGFDRQPAPPPATPRRRDEIVVDSP